MAEDAGDFAGEPNKPETVRAVSEGFVLDFEDFVVKLKNFGERSAWGDFGIVWVEFEDAVVVGAEGEFIGGGEHAKAHEAAKFASGNLERLRSGVSFGDDSAGGNPDGEHVFADVGRATNDLDKTVVVGVDGGVQSFSGVDFAEMKMKIILI